MSTQQLQIDHIINSVVFLIHIFFQLYQHVNRLLPNTEAGSHTKGKFQFDSTRVWLYSSSGLLFSKISLSRRVTSTSTVCFALRNNKPNYDKYSVDVGSEFNVQEVSLGSSQTNLQINLSFNIAYNSETMKYNP